MFASLRKLFGERNTTIVDSDLITVLYGGKSGNAEFVASQMTRHLSKGKLKVRLKNMSSYKAENLLDESRVLFVVSTYGEGDPPPAALRFFRQLNELSTVGLANLEFALCALGDSEYEHFCQAGKDLEKRLLQMGAQAILPRVDCDAAFEKTAASWISSVSKLLTVDDSGDSFNLDAIQSHQWHTAVIREKHQLNPGSKEAVWHLNLAIDEQTVKYQTGDSIGIVPRNPEELIGQILGVMQLAPDELVDKEQTALSDFLQTKAELTNLSRDLLKRYLSLCADENLADLLKHEHATLDYLHQHDFLDLLHDFPCRLNAADLPGLLDKPKIRYYSIASYQVVSPNELHLTVKKVQYEHKKRRRHGAASSYLSHSLEVGISISFFISPDDDFRLPDPSVPAIFIGAGTGIAPIRAFLSERSQQADSRNWLFFGEKTRAVDYLYSAEMESRKETDELERLNLAFSRDQQAKIYVQDLLLQEAKEVQEWLKAGAHIYVCGSRKMGQAVKETFNKLATTRNSEYTVAKLLAEKRYHEDVY
ncbi:diflavin oxidoreductase [Mangrovibacterium lignilyticum]|uniref:diflavin oxidoreductase n=1 Tax=Mangrovibacterium lignilyticum TaxID=2668052 RepID=UPI0013D6D2E0|nr:flavodoxin domain-containing protein [Mangrovibacterium lignilyticum]